MSCLVYIEARACVVACGLFSSCICTLFAYNTSHFHILAGLCMYTYTYIIAVTQSAEFPVFEALFHRCHACIRSLWGTVQELSIFSNIYTATFVVQVLYWILMESLVSNIRTFIESLCHCRRADGIHHHKIIHQCGIFRFEKTVSLHSISHV